MEWKIEELLPPEAIEVLKQESINVVSNTLETVYEKLVTVYNNL